MTFSKIHGVEIEQIYENMGHKDGDAFEEFWAEQNRLVGRPIPPYEVSRRHQLIKRAQDGGRVTLEEQRVPKEWIKEEAKIEDFSRARTKKLVEQKKEELKRLEDDDVPF